MSARLSVARVLRHVVETPSSVVILKFARVGGSYRFTFTCYGHTVLVDVDAGELATSAGFVGFTKDPVDTLRLEVLDQRSLQLCLRPAEDDQVNLERLFAEAATQAGLELDQSKE